MNETIAFTNTSVVTGDRAGTVLTDQTVTIGADGKIAQSGPTSQTDVPANARVVDGAGQFLMPGMINAHAHLFSDASRYRQS